MKLLALISFAATSLLLLNQAMGQTTQARQAVLTPDIVLTELIEGNGRFVAGEISDPKIKLRRAKVAHGQFPKAVVLSCLDSRVPVELIFDQGFGDLFVGRVAGNVSDRDQLGSMEFATKVAGARLVLVLGHTSCGAVQGACAGVEFGNLTQLLKKIQPAVKAVEGFDAGDRTADNPEFVEMVTKENVRQTVARIRRDSEILAGLEATGRIKIAGGIYDLETGRVTMLD